MTTARARLFVSGRVQGVWFRQSTSEQAAALALTGWVRNRRDGRVEALVEGPRDRVDALIRWCQGGPPLARVDDVQVAWEVPTGEGGGFSVERTA